MTQLEAITIARELNRQISGGYIVYVATTNTLVRGEVDSEETEWIVLQVEILTEIVLAQ